MSTSLELRTRQVGPYSMNAYALVCPVTKQSVLIDPGDDPDVLQEMLKDTHPIAILLTHTHFDHVGAVSGLKEKTGAAVMLHKGDLDIYMRADKQGALWGFQIEQPPAPDMYIVEGDELTVGSFHLKVLHTPGHSPGGICLYGEGVILPGDTIFAGSVGR